MISRENNLRAIGPDVAKMASLPGTAGTPASKLDGTLFVVGSMSYFNKRTDSRPWRFHILRVYIPQHAAGARKLPPISLPRLRGDPPNETNALHPPELGANC